jgi:UDP-2,3-diacylglucosamine pyrophosphatase LpxH
VRTVVVSDVHVGTNYKTCWYQQSVHEPYLLALLEHVIGNAGTASGQIGRLVVLGDLFDFWTYPPSMRPPTVAEILAANPNVFGPNGKLRDVIEALDGNVVYLRGNHDITITQADIDLMTAGSHSIALVEDEYVVDGIVLSHGHRYTMFNAPDPRFPGEVPVGHFVTRAIAYYLDSHLGAGQTAADLPNQGSPYGLSLPSLVPELATQLATPSITGALLDYVCARCGMTQAEPIVLADGSTTTIAAAKTKYDGLWTEWAVRNGAGEIGATIAAKAAQADYDGSYMAWFAQRAAFSHSARGIVTGHTHIPRFGIENSACLYVNSGFECPAVPDIAAGRAGFTFTVVDDGPSLGLFEVVRSGGEFSIDPATAPPDRTVYAPFADFSCYVQITNNGDDDLVEQAATASSGFYVVPPPQRVGRGERAQFWIEDLAGLSGAEGSVMYGHDGGIGSIQLDFGCPTGFAANYARGGGSLVASSPRPPDADSPPDTVPVLGHPLFVDFYVKSTSNGGDGVSANGWTPTSVLAEAVDLAGFDYDPAQDIIYSKMYPLQRSLGYAYGYDAAALLMSAVLDCEPIFFEYRGRTWMIELWKGQYGLETGCEIGLYYRTPGASSPVYAMLDQTVGKRPHDAVASHGQFFDCVEDADRLTLSSVLYRNGQRLFKRGPEKHWWLTGFKWGVFSQPEDLRMDVTIECRDAAMRTALGDSLAAMGYDGVDVVSNTVSFTFDSPKTFQPRSDYPQAVAGVNAANQAIVAAYDALRLPNNDPNQVSEAAGGLIGGAIALYSQTFAEQAIVNLAKASNVQPSRTVLVDLVTKLSSAGQGH